MKNKTISENLKQFWLAQCDKPVVGGRFKEAYDTLKDFIDERKNHKAADSGASKPTAPGG